MNKHKAEPRKTSPILQRGIDWGLTTQKCKCGRAIVQVENHAVDGFGKDAFFWRHLPVQK